jgi:hypothetical protein
VSHRKSLLARYCLNIASCSFGIHVSRFRIAALCAFHCGRVFGSSFFIVSYLEIKGADGEAAPLKLLL